MKKLSKNFRRERNTVEAMYEATRAACSCRTVYCAGQCNRDEMKSNSEWERLYREQTKVYQAAGAFSI